MAIITLIILFLSVSITTSSSIQVSCNKTDNDICLISNVSIDSSSYNFGSSNPSSIHTLQLTTSTVTHLSSDLCHHFSNLISLSAKGIFLQIIPSTTFTSCLAITKIDLSQNGIKNLEIGTFAGLKHLTTLSLHNNMLTFFDPAIIKGSTGITQLALVSNNLMELDEELLLKYLPNLKTIYLNDNQLPCDRIHAIKETFAGKNTTIRLSYVVEKQRNFDMIVMSDIKCVTRGIWTTELMKLCSIVKGYEESKTQNLETEIKNNFSTFESRAEMLYETIKELNHTNELSHKKFSTLDASNEELLRKIDVLERKNAAMQLLLDTTQHTTTLHTYLIYGNIGMMIIFLLLFCLANCSHRHRRSPRGIVSTKHQLSLETNVCRL